MNKRLRAFTLMELIVAMAIGAVVLTLAFGGFQFWIKNSQRQSLIQAQNLKFESALAIIYSDFYSAEEVISAENKISFYDQDRQIDYINYPQYTVRIQLMRRDTIHHFKLGMNGSDLNVILSDQEPIVLSKPISAYDKLSHFED